MVVAKESEQVEEEVNVRLQSQLGRVEIGGKRWHRLLLNAN